ncbi:MAG: hypothetical protein DMG62_24385 [Acidobacteria bacterium]|nr:MAG: hypothetical protein DMG62_24385 [Acidobacteriota bacterium]
MKLTLCAFKASKIDVPVKCYDINNINNVEDCLIEIRTNPNFYSTYMGYYLKAGKECS